MPRHVFISHSSLDKDAANAVREAFESNGLSCWIAPRDIIGGQDWSAAIVAGLEECPAVVIILSQNSNASEQVKREVQRSFEKHKIVVPLRIDDVIPTASMEYYLAPVHWINALDGVDAHLPTLLESVKQQLQMGVSPPSAIDVRPSGAMPLALERHAPASEPTQPTVNLPAPTAPYIGRKDELSKWQALLSSESTRVLTLVGFGGMGKTRSALELGYRTAQDFADGACWVPLEEAHTPAEAWSRIASELGINLQPQTPVRDQLIAFLKPRRMLLLLDNLEQIPDAGVAVNPLVQAAPGVRFLVTSRKALEIASEQIVEVPPLPDEEAQNLFADRARGRQADFEITADNQADVAEICRRLEGMPLAIELASSRVAGMTPHEILERLTDWNKVLQTRAPHLPPRQRAMQGAIEWSHELLSDDDKDLFAQLAVFANGFTLSAAEDVCDAFDVFEGVHELRRHSFLRAQQQAATQQTRFFMLQLVREYAGQHLSDDEIPIRHAEFFLKFAQDRSKLLRTAAEKKALDELAPELDNLLEAVATAKKAGKDDLLAQLALASSLPLTYLGNWAEAKSVLEEGVAAATRQSGDAGLRGRLLIELAGVTLDLGDPAVADQQASDAFDVFTGSGDSGNAARALNVRGLAALATEDTASAQAQFNKALDLWGSGEPAGQGIALHNLAMLALRDGDEAAARDLYRRSLEARRSAGDMRGEAETLGNLGALEFTAGKFDAARDLYLQSLQARRILRDNLGIALMLYNLGELAEKGDDVARTVGLYVQAGRLFRDLGSGFADAVTEKLAELQQKFGDEKFAAARDAAVRRGWEPLVDEG